MFRKLVVQSGKTIEEIRSFTPYQAVIASGDALCPEDGTVSLNRQQVANVMRQKAAKKDRLKRSG